jgi:hypothetical protein
MKNLLNKALTEAVPVDIYLKVKNGEKTQCILGYTAFLVTNIDETKNTFFGYTVEERTKKFKNKIITEEAISLICDVKFENASA